jgi:von Willebrand factor type A domain
MAQMAIGAAALAGCGGSLQVTPLKTDQAKPANVWVFFTVQKGKEPVAGLAATDFEIYEDEQIVSKYESKQTIQNPEVAAVMYTLLLLDMSGSVTESGQAGALVDAADHFAERVGKTQKVGVYAFDGAEKLHPVVPFTEAPGSVEGGLAGLRTYKAKDPSTNLNGAIVEGLQTLRAALDQDKKPLKFGTLVVFSDGTDRAARVTHKQVEEEMKRPEYATYEMFAIGVGAEISKGELNDVGRDGTELATDSAKVKESFEKVAARIEAHTKRFYLLSYCTPARNGDHRVRIVAKAKQGNGSLECAFNANGFGPPPDCDPERKPTFSLDVTAPPAPPADAPPAPSKKK